MEYAMQDLHYSKLPVFVMMHERELYPHTIDYLGMTIPFPMPIDLKTEPMETSVGVHFRDFTVFRKRPTHVIPDCPFIDWTESVWVSNTFGVPMKGYIQPFQSLPFRYAMYFLPHHERAILLEQIRDCRTYRVAVAYLPRQVTYNGKKTRYICIL